MITLSDMHCHLLSGVDDGARDEEMTKEMLRIAANNGINTIITTPHFHPRRGDAGPQPWEKALLQARKIAKKEGLDLQLFPGCEVMYRDDMVEMLDQGNLWTMANSRYVLVEFPTNSSFDYIRIALQKIRIGGYLPILAHVERYGEISKLEQVDDIIGIGTYIQMNASTTLFGRKFFGGGYIRKLLKNQMIHFVGSDAHDTKHRPPEILDAYQYIEELCGTEYARAVCHTNTLRLVEGEIIDV